LKAGDKRTQQWNENYHRLREAGFSSAEAGRINKSNDKTEFALRTGQIPEKSAPQQKAAQAGVKARQAKKENELVKAAADDIIKQLKAGTKKAAAAKLPKIENLDTINNIINRWYTPVQDAQVIYYSRFTYVIEFSRVDGTVDNISITSEYMMNADEVKNAAKMALVDAYYNPGKLPGKHRNGSDPTKAMPLFSTIKIVARYYNADV